MTYSWQEYQDEAAAFFRALGLDVQTNVRVKGVRTHHDVDVVVRSHHVGFDVLWLVECKYWRNRVSKLHVLALREIVTDVGADRGIILSEVGFQSGALEAAKLTNVRATSLEVLTQAARADIVAMRLRELYDRAESCKERYWDIPKNERIERGLRPEFGPGYSGAQVVELAEELLARAVRGVYPFELHSLHALVAFGESRKFATPEEVITLLEPMLAELEKRLLDRPEGE